MQHVTANGRGNCPACIEMGFTRISEAEHDRAALARDDDDPFRSDAEAVDYMWALLRGDSS